MDNRPIGLFDSGLGGLTALKALHQLMPQENLIYFSDSGRMPYGGRSAAQLREIARQDIELLLAQNVKAIIAACGTISSAAAEVLAGCPVPTVGVMEPGVRALSRTEGNGVLAVLATPASISDGGFRRGLEQLCPDRRIADIPCPDFAPLIEHGHTAKNDPLLRDAMERYLRPLREAQPDAVLLGCTHYGIIAEGIRDYLGSGVRLVSASECAAEELRELLVQNDSGGSGGTLRFITSGSTEEFTAFASRLLGVDGIAAEKTGIMEVISE